MRSRLEWLRNWPLGFGRGGLGRNRASLLLAPKAFDVEVAHLIAANGTLHRTPPDLFSPPVRGTIGTLAILCFLFEARGPFSSSNSALLPCNAPREFALNKMPGK